MFLIKIKFLYKFKDNIVFSNLDGIAVSCSSNYRLSSGVGAAVLLAGGSNFEVSFIIVSIIKILTLKKNT